MATIEKRNGKYRVKIRKKGQLPATATFPNRKMAEHWAAQTELRMITNRYFGKAYSTTFEELVTHYQTRVQPLEHEESTIETSQPIINFWVGRFGERFLADIRKSDILDARDDLVARGLKPGTVNRYVTVLSAIFTEAVDRDWMEMNPCYRIKRLKNKSDRGHVLTREEQSELAVALSKWGGRTKNTFVFALHTGARLSEVENLTYDDIDFKRATVTFRNTKNGENRTVPIKRSLLEHIPTQDIGMICPFYFNRTVWNIAVQKAGLKGFRFHDLRHTFITRAIGRGVSPVKVAAYVGHKSLTMTAKYTHLDTSDLGDVLD